MTELDFLFVFERYGADTALVAIFVVLCVWLAKKTFLKNYVNTPVVALLPFVLGVVLFFILQIILHPSWEYLSLNAALILQRGMVVGCIASLNKAFFANFLNGNTAAIDRVALIASLLESVVAAEVVQEVAALIAQSVSYAYTTEDETSVAAILTEYANEAYSESELAAMAQAIVRTLKTAAA